MLLRTFLANILSRSLTASMCILFAVLLAAFLTSAHAASVEPAPVAAAILGGQG
ncbi:MAG: hypothetical protein JO111_08870 [Caulobacteraceae bacterium]|nr:hypothetical protein [Caulobacteraceae bacterium]